MNIARTMHCDVVVVGGGPAGIAAATRAAECGARVAIVDSGLAPGGQIWRHGDPATLPRLARRWLARLQATRAQWLLQATVVDGDVARGLTVVAPDGVTRLRAPRLVIATGARELFLPYPGWTLPNVMGVGGAQAMLKAGMNVRTKRVVVAGSGPLLLPVAAAMATAGARVVMVAEQTSMLRLGVFALSMWSRPSKLLLAARYRAAISARALRTGTWVERADGVGRVEAVTLTTGSRRWVEPCDLVCCSYGLIPSIELARLLRCETTDGRVVVDAMQRTTVPGVFCAGEATGIAGDEAAIAEGEIAGLTAASPEAPISPALRRRQVHGHRFAQRLRNAFPLHDGLRTLATADTILCRCEDVRLEQIEPAWTGRQAKLYTRAGMGPCQGAVCGPALERLFGWQAGTVRPPLFAPTLKAWLADAADETTVSAEEPRP